MNNKPSRKQQLLNRIVAAQSKFPEYADMFEDIRLEVENRYPQFNSKSTWSVTCSICGNTREIQIKDLYNGKGLGMCSACHSHLALSEARSIQTSEVHHKAAVTFWETRKKVSK